MSQYPLLAQIVAVLSRRTPAFQPAPGQPVTFSAALRLLRRSHRNTATTVVPPTSPPAPAPADKHHSQTTSSDNAPTGTVGLTEALAQFVDEFAALPGQQRLNARSRPEYRLVQLSLALLDALDKSPIAWPRDLNHAVDRALHFAHDLDLARDPTSDRDRYRALVFDLDLALTLDVARAQNRARTRDLTLARDLARDLASGPNLARTQYRRLRDRARYRVVYQALDRNLERNFERNLVLTVSDLFVLRALHDAIANVVVVRLQGTEFTLPTYDTSLHSLATTDLRELSHHLLRLDSAGHTMIDTDLRDMDLRDIRQREHLLDGVRYSTGTRWPPEIQEWVDQHSERIGLGLYEIHAHDDSHDRATNRG